MAITRRTALKYGLGGAALLGAGSVGLSLWPTRLREPRAPLAVLTRQQFSILAAVADTFHPAAPPFPSAWDVQLPEAMDAYLATLHPGDVSDLVQALGLLENAAAGLLLDGRLGTFTGASPQVREATLLAWKGSAISIRRTAYKALHKLCNSSYFANPGIYEQVGYAIPVGLARGGQ